MNFQEKINNIKLKLDKEYNIISNFCFNFLLKNNIGFNSLNNLNINTKDFFDFNVVNKKDSISLTKDNVTIEVTFVPKNTFKKLKKTKTTYDLEKLKEGSILDITFILENNKFYLFNGENKEIIIQTKDINASYSPTKKDWHASENFTDNFYNKVLYFENPCNQIHYIKENKDGSFYKLISLGDGDFLPLELFSDKKSNFGEIITKTKIDKKSNLIKPF